MPKKAASTRRQPLTTDYDCIVIGAGAAGLMFAAALDLRRLGKRGLLLERTARPGTKLLMSGNGQCNITHAGSIKAFPGCYGEAGARIRSALYRHSNEDLLSFLHQAGIETVSREDDRIFPASLRAAEIRELLLFLAAKNGFALRTETEACAIASAPHKHTVSAVTRGSERQTFSAKQLILATGGCSYPASGSDGSFFAVLARDLGLNITPLRPALAPITVEEYPFASLSGLSFPQVEVTIRAANGRNKSRLSGAMLFTHRAFSGPVILDSSYCAEQGDALLLNYLCRERSEVQKRLVQESTRSKATLANQLASLFHLPKRFAAAIAERAQGSPKRAAALLTEDRFLIRGTGDFSTAMVTAGGIALDQVDTKTMRLKGHVGIYAIGEALDVAGRTGGYNLQFAWSSACAAADDLRRRW